MKINNKKVVIVGAGAVGSTYAHNLVVDDLADEIAIIKLQPTVWTCFMRFPI